MASKSFSEEDFSCPVCCEIFKDPVFLTCTHSICKVCLKTFWETKGSRECPVCKQRTLEADPPINLHLRNLCETFLQQRSQREPFCSLHRSELKLYCEDDKQLVCLVCRDSKLHKNHNFSPISEAALEHRAEVKLKLQSLLKKLDIFNEAKTTFDETAQYIRAQVEQTEWQIKQEFEKLHQFLQDEEATRIAALREEKEQKSQMMKKMIEKISGEVASLSDTIRALEEEMGADDITVLQNYKITVKRVQCTLQDPKKIPGALINVAKHLGNLKFRVWEKMQDIVQYTPVTLDPNTANPFLILSEDLTRMRCSNDKQQLPNNPERFDEMPYILGSEGFNAGTHCWDVEVRNDKIWNLGVKTESGDRKGTTSALASGVWGLFNNEGNYKAVSLWSATCITVSQKPKKIRVQLDWDSRKLSFSDPDNNTHLHTFTHTFTERLFPFFFSGSLRILPVKAVVVKQLS